MMRKLAAIACIVLAWPVWAAFNTHGWPWQSAVPNGAAPAGFVRLSVTPEVFDKATPSLEDLRLLDSAGSLVPFVVYAERVDERRREEWQDLRLIDRTFQEGAYSRVVLDFGRALEKNRLRIRFGEGAYHRTVDVEGSPDNQNWEMVVKGKWVFRVQQDGRDFESNIVEFPANTFPFLRVTAFSIPDETTVPRIDGVDAAMVRTEAAGELLPVPVTMTAVRHDDKKKCSFYEMDLGYRNLPVTRVEISFSDPYFHRAYELLGRNAREEVRAGRTDTDAEKVDVPWQTVARGVVYRVQRDKTADAAAEGEISESGPLENLRAPYRYLSLRVYNSDNPPLTLRGTPSVFRRDAGIAFDYKPDETYRLCFGNARASAPQFDLAASVKGIQERDLPRLVPSTPSPLESAEPERPWTERHPVIIWIALAFSVAVMAGLIAVNLKRLGAKAP